jgi:hypothetical protein
VFFVVLRVFSHRVVFRPLVVVATHPKLEDKTQAQQSSQNSFKTPDDDQ